MSRTIAKPPVQYPELLPGALFVRSINHGNVNPNTDRAEVLNMLMQGLSLGGSNHKGMGANLRLQDICFTCGGVPLIDLHCVCEPNPGAENQSN